MRCRSDGKRRDRTIPPKEELRGASRTRADHHCAGSRHQKVLGRFRRIPPARQPLGNRLSTTAHPPLLHHGLSPRRSHNRTKPTTTPCAWCAWSARPTSSSSPAATTASAAAASSRPLARRPAPWRPRPAPSAAPPSNGWSSPAPPHDAAAPALPTSCGPAATVPRRAVGRRPDVRLWTAPEQPSILL